MSFLGLAAQLNWVLAKIFVPFLDVVPKVLTRQFRELIVGTFFAEEECIARFGLALICSSCSYPFKGVRY